MSFASKKFRVVRVTTQTDEGFEDDSPLNRFARVVLEETGQANEDRVVIESYDGSLDGYNFEIGDVYLIGISRDTQAGFDRASDRGGPPHASHPAAAQPSSMEETVESHEPGLKEPEGSPAV